ncbi:MAG: glycosyltransferase family 39 protein [Candidatus Eisenbacteria bacterium]|nr:glycosyltransferase family 39 protein [Candidatus Eisenbacteria bacterium]
MLAATVVAAALRFYRLGAQSLWIDEVLTWYSANVGSAFGVRDLTGNVHGPLYALLVHAVASLRGSDEWTLRLPSALCGVATVPAMAWVAARWLGRREAEWAAWLAAVSPFLVWYSQEARPYAMLILFTCVSGALMLELSRAARARTAFAWTTASIVGLLANPSFAFVLPLHLRWWLADSGARARRMRFAAIAGVALAALALPWAPQALRTWDWQRLHPGRERAASEERLRGAATFHAAALPFAIHSFAVGYTLGPSLRELIADSSACTLARHALEIAATALVFAGLGFAGLAALRRRRRLGDAALWLAAPAAVVSWFALSNFKAFRPRYLAASYPAFLLLIAAALVDLKPRARWIMAGAVAVLWAASLSHHYFDPRYGKDDHRGAAALVAARAVAGEKVLAVNSIDPMIYYYRGPLPLVPFWLGFASDPPRLDPRLDQAMSGASGVWVVLSRPEDLDPAGRFARRMDSRYPGAERFAFEGVRVWHVKFDVAPGTAAAGN